MLEENIEFFFKYMFEVRIAPLSRISETIKEKI